VKCLAGVVGAEGWVLPIVVASSAPTCLIDGIDRLPVRIMHILIHEQLEQLCFCSIW
jgi:hypothetical protein